MTKDQMAQALQDAARFRWWAEHPVEIWSTPKGVSVEKTRVRVEDGPDVLGEFTPSGNKLADLRTAIDLAIEKST